MLNRVTVSREAHFNAAHRLHVPNWSESKNTAAFGLCNNPYFHGHNYKLIVSVTGEVDPESGYVVDMKVLKRMIKDKIENKFDHKNLNEEVFEFNHTQNQEAINPTAENIARVIHSLLKAELSSELTLKITLYETERNFVECSD